MKTSIMLFVVSSLSLLHMSKLLLESLGFAVHSAFRESHWAWVMYSKCCHIIMKPTRTDLTARGIVAQVLTLIFFFNHHNSSLCPSYTELAFKSVHVPCVAVYSPLLWGAPLVGAKLGPVCKLLFLSASQSPPAIWPLSQAPSVVMPEREATQQMVR